MSTEPIKSDSKVVQLEKCADFVRPADVLALAKKAMMASRKAASLMEESNILAAEFDDPHFLRFVSHWFNAFVPFLLKI